MRGVWGRMYGVRTEMLRCGVTPEKKGKTPCPRLGASMGAWVMVQFLVLGLRQQWPQYVEHEPMNGCVFLRAGGRTKGGGGGKD